MKEDMSLSNLGTVALHAAKVPTNVFSSTLKDICGYFQCAPFPRLQTGKDVWVLSFDP